jgi:hypothetical protein
VINSLLALYIIHPGADVFHVSQYLKHSYNLSDLNQRLSNDNVFTL